MDVSRIQSQTITSLSTEGSGGIGKTATAVRDASDFQAEIAPNYYFKPNSMAPMVNSLITDAIADNVVQMRTEVLNYINHQVNATKLSEQAKLIRLNFRVSGTPDEQMEAFKEEVRKFSKGSSAYELALIEEIRKLDGLEQVSLLLTDDFVYSFLRRYEAELRAFLNIHEVLVEHKDLAPIEELTGAYETVLVQSPSVMHSLHQMVKQFGLEKIQHWAPFLIRSVVADMVHPQAGADKIQLMFILQELKGFRILNTFTAMLDDLEEKRMKQKVENLLLQSFEYIDQPLVMIAVIEKWLAACTSEEQILFFQDYRRVFARVADEAYQSEEQKRNALAVLQNKIDELIYSEGE
jgi:hypothetical protein